MPIKSKLFPALTSSAIYAMLRIAKLCQASYSLARLSSVMLRPDKHIKAKIHLENASKVQAY